MVTNQPGDWKERTQKIGEAIGGRMGSRLRDAGRTLVKEQKTRACEELETISEVAHEAADRLHERDDHFVADAVDAFAEEIENAAEFIREHSVQEMIERGSAFAKQAPEVFIGGAFILGLAAGRFLRASKPSVSRSASPGGQTPTQSGRSGVTAPGGEYETHVSEAGPINVSPRNIAEPAEQQTSGSRQPNPDAGQERLNPHQADHPQGAHRSTDTSRAAGEHEARESGVSTESVRDSQVRLETESPRKDEPLSGPDIRASGGHDDERTEQQSQERNP